MIKTSSTIQRAIRYHYPSFRAIRKLEVTYNYRANSYHPHYHFLVNSAHAAEELRARWLRACNDRAEPIAQDVRQADTNALRELCKYFSKVMCSSHSGDRVAVPIYALDVIFRAMRNRRVYQSVGFRAPSVESPIDSSEMRSKALKRVDESIVWQWEQELADWVDQTTGEVLSEYDPSDRYRSFVETIGTVEAGENSDRSTTPPETEAQQWDGNRDGNANTTTGKSETAIGSVRSTSVPPPSLRVPSKRLPAIIEKRSSSNEKSNESERKKNVISSIGSMKLGAISRSKQELLSRQHLNPRDIATIVGNGENADE